jgi:hypothetical protein
MSGTFSYGFGSNSIIDPIRMLISDTQQYGPDGSTPAWIFADQEIQMAYAVQAGTWQSGQRWSPPTGQQTLPSVPVSPFRVAAILLESLASNKARLASIASMLDVRLGNDKAAQELRALAKQYRQNDDESGAFAIIEQVNDVFSFRQRFWKEVQRQQAGI